MIFAPEWSQRLLRKGTLVEETYQTFVLWDDARTIDENIRSGIEGRQATIAWEKEVLTTIRRRIRHIEKIRPLILLAKSGMSILDWRDCLRLWIGATEEPFHSFAINWLFSEHQIGRYQIRSEDVVPFIKQVAKSGVDKKKISEYGTVRAARDLLKTATDLGLLAGKGPTKTFATISMSDDCVLFYAHLISELEGSAIRVPSSILWRLAYLTPSDVHTALLRLHQFKRLDYQVAGSLVQISLPYKTTLEFAERLAA